MKILQKIMVLTLAAVFIINYSYSQGVKISASGGDPVGSAILEVESTTQGLLIPRMTSDQRTDILTPAAGLLVYDTDSAAFYLRGTLEWINLSSSSEIWTKNAIDDVYLTDVTKNIGVGTNSPSGKFIIKADAAKAPDDVLFEIQDVAGEPIFVVTSEGARMYVKDYTLTKGVSGGFAVGRYGAAKGLPTQTYFMVTPDSTRVYTDSKAKGISGGFAVGRYGAAKAIDTLFFYTNKDSTRVYTGPGLSGKGISGGFAVGRYGAAKGSSENFVHVVDNNAFIGYSAGYNTTTGDENIFIGTNAGVNNITGSNNVFIGNSSGSHASGLGMTGNVFIGNQAGAGETGNNKLYISNNATAPGGALIYGNFDPGSERVFLNGNLRFNPPGSDITMPINRGTPNHVLTTNGGGGTNWINVNNLVTHPNEPYLVITEANGYSIEETAITTLIVKTKDQGLRVIVRLPSVFETPSRIITIKNFMQEPIEVPIVTLAPSGTDLIDGLGSLNIGIGESYTIQASIEDGTWYIINKYIP